MGIYWMIFFDLLDDPRASSLDPLGRVGEPFLRICWGHVHIWPYNIMVGFGVQRTHPLI